ncbi:hypothetical protein [Aeromicrobium sp. HA]|uniref:hypothetical protein n=1 Tax=Aeromicrobium sp. HA TaxID=3009077 RepID=UPI0022AED006|nr:hypothetical protein [Aeromicrobium sp. HA]
MESLADWWFGLGFMFAFYIAPAAITLAFALRPSSRLRTTTVAIGLVTWLLWLAQFAVWTQSHDEPIPGETVPNELFPIHEALAHASAAGCVILLPLAVAVVVTGRPARQHVRVEG